MMAGSIRKTLEGKSVCVTESEREREQRRGSLCRSRSVEREKVGGGFPKDTTIS